MINLTNDFGFGESRPTQYIEGVCIHTTESADSSTALSTARWQASSASGSYHDVIDRSGEVVWCNTDNWMTWSAGPTGNWRYVHISFNAKAAWSRETWLNHEAMLRAGAERAAMRCKAYGIPVREISPADMRARVKGLTTHANISAAWGETDHTDPGRNFPMDVFLRYVNEAMGNTQTQGEDDMGLNETFRSAVNDKFVLTIKEAIRQTDGNAWTIKNILTAPMASKVKPEIKINVTEFIRNIDFAAYSLLDALVEKKYKSRVPGSTVELTLPDYIRNIDRFTFESRQMLEKVDARLEALEKGRK